MWRHLNHITNKYTKMFDNQYKTYPETQKERKSGIKPDSLSPKKVYLQ